MQLLKHRLFRLFFYIFLALTVLLAVTLATLLLAVKCKPAFYAKSLKVEQSVLVQKSKAAVEKTMGTFEKLKPTETNWKTEYTEDEINGYLAVDLKRDYPKILPKEIKNPRIQLLDDQLEFACEIDSGSFSGVLDLGMKIQFPSPNSCEIRFQKAKLGLLPFSNETIRDLLADGLRQSGAKVEIKEIEGEPAFVANFAIPLEEKKLLLLLENLSVQNGALSLAGSVEKLKKR